MPSSPNKAVEIASARNPKALANPLETRLLETSKRQWPP